MPTAISSYDTAMAAAAASISSGDYSDALSQLRQARAHLGRVAAEARHGGESYNWSANLEDLDKQIAEIAALAATEERASSTGSTIVRQKINRVAVSA